MKPLVLTFHAPLRMVERHIDPEWIDRTVRAPDWIEPEPNDPQIERRFRAIPEYGDRILRVAVAETPTDIRVISVLFDRGAKRRHARQQL